TEPLSSSPSVARLSATCAMSFSFKECLANRMKPLLKLSQQHRPDRLAPGQHVRAAPADFFGQDRRHLPAQVVALAAPFPDAVVRGPKARELVHRQRGRVALPLFGDTQVYQRFV